jgi:hypothetical protein
LETAVLARAGTPTKETGAAPALPSLSTLIRYRARLDRDWRRAGEELEALRRDRAVPPSPAQLRLAADLVKRGRAAAAAERAPEECTNENGIGTNEPTAVADRTNDFARGTDEPRHPVPPLPETRTDEPDNLPAPLNRHQRRRLAALARREQRRAA